MLLLKHFVLKGQILAYNYRKIVPCVVVHENKEVSFGQYKLNLLKLINTIYIFVFVYFKIFRFNCQADSL